MKCTLWFIFRHGWGSSPVEKARQQNCGVTEKFQSQMGFGTLLIVKVDGSKAQQRRRSEPPFAFGSGGRRSLTLGMEEQMETVSLVASIVSVIIGGFAIWLSVTFYRLSNKISEDTKEAAKGISASVDRLESLFDRLYSDTFSMMKDTVSDMRKHIWPEKEQHTDALVAIEKKADQKVEELRAQIASELTSVMHQVGRTDTKITGVEERLTGLIDKAITQSRRVESEAQEEISRADVFNGVISFIQRYGESPVGRVLRHPLTRGRFGSQRIRQALELLVHNEIIEASGKIDDPDTIVRMSRQRQEPKAEEDAQQSPRRVR